MPTDNSKVIALIEAIGNVRCDISDDSSNLSHAKRQDLIRNAEKLAIAAREPEENLYFQATQTAQNAAIRTAIDMGIFEKVPRFGEGISATDLGIVLSVEKNLLGWSKTPRMARQDAAVADECKYDKVRIMRACTSTHLFQETSPYFYTHNAFSNIFLTPANRDMFKQMYDFLGQGVYSLPHFLESTKYQNPTDYDHGAFQYGHHTKLGFWEYLKEVPERMKVFNSGMQSLATVGGATKSAGAYPYGEELGKEEAKETDVLIVDVGGGKGQALEAIKEAFPGLKGRMVLQDVGDVIEDAKTAGLPAFIEPMAVSFFEKQPVKGALVYHFRRIFHDWSDKVSHEILQNTVQAMDTRSRILVTDTVIPIIGTPRHVALQDINMMSFGGMERTQTQWEELLKGVGLKIKKFWASEGNLQNVIEATL